MDEEMNQNNEEAILSTAFSWMRKSADDKQEGVLLCAALLDVLLYCCMACLVSAQHKVAKMQCSCLAHVGCVSMSDGQRVSHLALGDKSATVSQVPAGSLHACVASQENVLVVCCRHDSLDSEDASSIRCQSPREHHE